MCTSMPWWTPWSCRVRIISSPVRSPTWASRGYLCPPKLRCRMRPSFVRSKTAPQASSSRARAGASLACSSAMRQLFRYWPPRMVSAKCTDQASRSSTLASAAARPPSAMTVCALPRSDLQISPTETPAADASIAARSPAPPAPITSTSCSNDWYSMSIRQSSSTATRQRRGRPGSIIRRPPRSAAPAVLEEGRARRGVAARPGSAALRRRRPPNPILQDPAPFHGAGSYRNRRSVTMPIAHSRT